MSLRVFFLPVCIYQKFSLTELVLERRNASLFIKPFYILKGGGLEVYKCLYLKLMLNVQTFTNCVFFVYFKPMRNVRTYDNLR